MPEMIGQAGKAGETDEEAGLLVCDEVRCLVMRALADGAGGAGLLGAGLAHDRQDGAGAASAIRAAAEAGIDLADRARTFRAVAETRSHVVVAEHIAMANDHCVSPPHPRKRPQDSRGRLISSVKGS